MVRDDFNITEMRAEGQDLPSPFIVTIPASRPVSSTHITSIDLWGDANPLGWLAHERTARGRWLGGQMTYVV